MEFWSTNRARGPGRSILPFAIALALLGSLSACADAHAQFSAEGDPRAGARLITRKSCGSCHEIPGINGANGHVGPSLAGIGKRQMIAGMLPNSERNLQYYLLHPNQVVAGNYMPDQGLTSREARDAAAYLLELR